MSNLKSWNWTWEGPAGWRQIPIPYRCRDCPYPGIGFICRSKDGSCLRTDVEELEQRGRSKKRVNLLGLGIPLSQKKEYCVWLKMEVITI